MIGEPETPTPRFRILELYCGIGGCAAALAQAPVEIVAAVDVNPIALAVYRHNFPTHPVQARNLDGLRIAELHRLSADLWWLSPPCQPFTRRGRQRDDRDPRSRSLLEIIDRLPELRPRYLALENVPEFRGSRTHERLLQVLEEGGYECLERIVCPSELGQPNRRRRYYLVAGLGPLDSETGYRPRSRRLTDCLDSNPEPSLWITDELRRRYTDALHQVAAEDPDALTACFTRAYGRSHVRSGSYLQTDSGLRRFSPREILCILGFPRGFELPAGLTRAQAWKLAGNSLSLEAVRSTLAAIPALGLRNESREEGKRPERGSDSNPQTGSAS